MSNFVDALAFYSWYDGISENQDYDEASLRRCFFRVRTEATMILLAIIELCKFVESLIEWEVWL